MCAMNVCFYTKQMFAMYRSPSGPVSIVGLNTLLCLHLRPLGLVVSGWPYFLKGMGYLIPRCASRASGLQRLSHPYAATEACPLAEQPMHRRYVLPGFFSSENKKASVFRDRIYEDICVLQMPIENRIKGLKRKLKYYVLESSDLYKTDVQALGQLVSVNWTRYRAYISDLSNS